MENLITSASNTNVKYLRKLSTSSKTRRDEGLAIAEGAHLVLSLLESNLETKMYFCAESGLANRETLELSSRLKASGVEQLIMTDGLFESITSVHAGVGIAAVFEIPGDTASTEGLSQSAVLLDSLQDPGNLGTIMRTATAFGVKKVLLSSDCASPWSPKALRSGMGAQFSLEVGEDLDLTKVVKSAKIPTLVTSLSKDSTSVHDLTIDGEVAWIFGNEGNGVGDELIRLASTQVHIPQADTTVESLNVAAATAVCLYEQHRQR